MLVVARTLAVLSALLSLVAVEIIVLQYLPIGFEATGAFGGYAFFTCHCVCRFGTSDCHVHRRSGQKASSSAIVALSGMSLLGLITLLAANLLRTLG